jgi:hypothetical protein
MAPTLFRLIRVLCESEITAAARVLSDGRIEVWLGDAQYGIRASAVFSRQELDEAANWLSVNAVKLYPDSQYARVSRLVSGWVASALQA